MKMEDESSLKIWLENLTRCDISIEFLQTYDAVG